MPLAIGELLLQIHGAIGASAIAAFYLYSDRTEGTISSLKGTDSVLTELRRKIALEFGECLQPLFRDPFDPSPLLGPDGTPLDQATYIERPTNPVGSEAFRETIREFVDDSGNSIADYRSLSLARAGWCFWSHLLSLSLLVLFVWQAIVLGVLFLDSKAAMTLPMWAVYVASTITGVLVVAAITAVLGRLRHYNRITVLRLKHGEL